MMILGGFNSALVGSGGSETWDQHSGYVAPHTAGDGIRVLGASLFGADVTGEGDLDGLFNFSRTLEDTTALNIDRSYAPVTGSLIYDPPNTHDPANANHYGLAGYFLGTPGDLDGNARGGAIYGHAVAKSPAGSNSVTGGYFHAEFSANSQTANAFICGVQGQAQSNPAAYASGGASGSTTGAVFGAFHVGGLTGLTCGIQANAGYSAGAQIGQGLYGARFGVTLIGTGAPEAVGTRTALSRLFSGTANAYYAHRTLGWGVQGGYTYYSDGGQAYYNTGNLNNYGICVQGVLGQSQPLFQAQDNTGAATWSVLMDGSISGKALKLSQSGNAGDVLTRDGSGNALWVTPTSGGGGLLNAFARVADSAGSTQFAAASSDAVQFAAGGSLAVAFDAVNKRVTYSFTPVYPVTSVNAKTGSVILGTDDVSEGATNLYWTPARFDTRLAAKSSSDLVEGSNLYYTNARADARITLQRGAVNGLASLDSGGKIPAGQLPSIAITDTFTAASQAAMLALTAQTGDVCVRSDINETFILSGSDPTVLANWTQLLHPATGVSSVNGHVGAVVLTTGDLSESGNLFYTDARSRSALSVAAAPLAYNSTTGVFSLPAAASGQSGYLTSADWSAFNGKQSALGYTPVNRAGDTLQGSVRWKEQPLTPAGGAVSPDASTAEVFTVSTGANLTINNPTNSTAGDRKLFRIKNTSSGSITLTLDTNFRFGGDLTSVAAVAAGKTAYVGVVYNGADGKWDVVSNTGGF